MTKKKIRADMKAIRAKRRSNVGARPRLGFLLRGGDDLLLPVRDVDPVRRASAKLVQRMGVRKPFEVLSRSQRTRRRMLGAAAAKKAAAAALCVLKRERMRTGADISEATLTVKVGDRQFGVDVDSAEFVKQQHQQQSADAKVKGDVTQAVLIAAERHLTPKRELQHLLSAADAGVKACGVLAARRRLTSQMAERTPIVDVVVEGSVRDAVVVDVVKLLDFLVNERHADKTKSLANLRVKLSGDGRQSTPSLHFLMITATLLLPDLCFRPRYCHTLALARGKEDREAIELLMNELRPTLESVAREGIRRRDGVVVAVEFVFCADWKFTALAFGLNAPSAKYFCIWCDCKKEQIADFETAWDSAEHQRTGRGIAGEESRPHAPKRGRRATFGIIAKSLLPFVQMQHVVVDPLHLLLRVSDVLQNQLVHYCEMFRIVLDLVRAARLAGVEWEPTTANDKRGCIKWTSLDGRAKLCLLTSLDLSTVFLVGARAPALRARLHEAYHLRFTEVWKGFRTIYQFINTDLNEGEEVPSEIQHVGSFATAVRTWASKFVGLFGRKAVTPYIHALVVHVPNMILRFGSIKSWTCQAQELKNAVQNKEVRNATSPQRRSRQMVEREHRLLALPETEPTQQKSRKVNPIRSASIGRIIQLDHQQPRAARCSFTLDDLEEASETARV